jgi:hypothetical protein
MEWGDGGFEPPTEAHLLKKDDINHRAAIVFVKSKVKKLYNP